MLSSYKNRITALDYNFISFSSQDPSHPINSLLEIPHSQNNVGWVSNRYCKYTQEIMIKFPNEVNIRQINILINEEQKEEINKKEIEKNNYKLISKKCL